MSGTTTATRWVNTYIDGMRLYVNEDKRESRVQCPESRGKNITWKYDLDSDSGLDPKPQTQFSRSQKESVYGLVPFYHGSDKKVVIGDLSPTISKLPSKIPVHNDPGHHIHQFHDDGKLFLIEPTIFCR